MEKGDSAPGDVSGGQTAEPNISSCGGVMAPAGMVSPPSSSSSASSSRSYLLQAGLGLGMGVQEWLALLLSH